MSKYTNQIVEVGMFCKEQFTYGDENRDMVRRFHKVINKYCNERVIDIEDGKAMVIFRDMTIEQFHIAMLDISIIMNADFSLSLYELMEIVDLNLDDTKMLKERPNGFRFNVYKPHNR